MSKERIDRVCELIDQAKSLLDEVITDKQSDFDDKSEKWQEGDKGQEAQENIDGMQIVSDNLDDAISTLGAAK